MYDSYVFCFFLSIVCFEIKCCNQVAKTLHVKHGVLISFVCQYMKIKNEFIDGNQWIKRLLHNERCIICYYIVFTKTRNKSYLPRII